MLRSTLAAFAAGTLAAAGLAQDGSVRLTDARPFLERNPGDWRVATEPTTGNPSFVYGSRIAFGGPQGNDAGWTEAARAVVNENREFFGFDATQLVTRQVKALALSRIGSSDKVAVVFDQVVDGIPVLGGSVSILFDRNSGDVLALDTTGAPYAERAATTPSVSASQAIAAAEVAYEAFFGARIGEVTSIEPVIVGPSAFFGHKSSLVKRGATLAWKIDAKTPGLRTAENVPMQGRVFIAADDGEALKVVPTAHAIDGKVSGNVNIGPEPNTTTNQETVGLAGVRIRQNNSTGAILATTDADGNFSMAQAGPLTLFVELRGAYCRVVNEGGTSTTFTQAGVTTGTPWNPLFNPLKSEFTTAEVAGWHHVMKFRDWVKSVDPSDTTMDFEVRTEVNKNDLTCNAYWDGGAINLERSDGGCTNTCYLDVVQHEEGHWANSEYNGNVSGAFHEGNADNFAYYINDDPCLTSFFGSGCLRTALQASVKKCPTDGDESCNGGASHTEGQALASAVWAVRSRLEAALGDAQSDLIADNLFLAWMQAYDDQAILNVILHHWLVLDDDNGNLNDGTPHLAHIYGGFNDYDWSLAPEIAISAAPADHSSIGDLQSVQIKALVNPFGQGLASVRVDYSTNGVSYTSIPMTATGLPNEYMATIPGVTSPNTIQWYVRAENSSNEVAFLPKENQASPRFYHVGQVVTIHQNNFEGGTDEGWTHVNLAGANGDQWQRNNPANSESSDDPNSAFSGTRVWGTDLSASGTDGEYEQDSSGELRSPSFNLSAATNVRLQYRRWLTVESGQFDQATIRVNGTTVYQNPTSGNLIDTSWILHDVNLTTIAAGNPAVQIAYRLTSDGGLQFGGWNIDDFVLYRVDANPAGFFQAYGSGCAGSGGLTPTLAGSGTPSPGQNVTITVGNGLPNGFGVLLLGTTQVALPALGGCTLLTGGALLPLNLTLNGSGTIALPGTIPLGIPANDTYWQWFGSDSGAPNAQYSTSNGLRMRIQ